VQPETLLVVDAMTGQAANLTAPFKKKLELPAVTHKLDGTSETLPLLSVRMNLRPTDQVVGVGGKSGSLAALQRDGLSVLGMGMFSHLVKKAEELTWPTPKCSRRCYRQLRLYRLHQTDPAAEKMGSLGGIVKLNSRHEQAVGDEQLQRGRAPQLRRRR